jgi:hypothetical protein
MGDIFDALALFGGLLGFMVLLALIEKLAGPEDPAR